MEKSSVIKRAVGSFIRHLAPVATPHVLVWPEIQCKCPEIKSCSRCHYILLVRVERQYEDRSIKVVFIKIKLQFRGDTTLLICCLFAEA